MTLKEFRNVVVRELYNGLGRGPKVLLSHQVSPEADYPYIIYELVQPRMPGPYNMRRESTGDPARQLVRRQEQPTGTHSFTACSVNRTAGDGTQIYGDDEALLLADQAQGWFLLEGKNLLDPKGIVVVDVTNTQPRSAFDVDETDRRYGFDVLFRYSREDTVLIDTIDTSKITIIEKEA